MPEIPTPTTIYFVADHTLLAKDIAMHIKLRGFQIRIFSNMELLLPHLSSFSPAAVLIETAFSDADLANIKKIEFLRRKSGKHFQIILMSARTNFETRLAVARTGADGHFTKQVDIAAFTDWLDAMKAPKIPVPFRILIIEDNANCANEYENVLAGAGMEVQKLTRLIDILHVISEYRPELVLMNVNMRACTGVDITRVIRQDSTYVDVPIVFLAEETCLNTQYEAIESGADDFLRKPIKPADLISSLSARITRYRLLRELIMKDSLTGLYNHATIKECLIREISQANRTGSPLMLSMIDIDFFKHVNDTFGHPAGDRVILSLSRLLRQRLRGGDIIGRYGGEEFAVILPNTTALSATHVLDEIRETFSTIPHHVDEREFRVTFSVGITAMDQNTDAETLFRNADSALYRSKSNGRNQLTVG